MVVRLAGVALSALRELHAAGIVGRSSEVTDARHLGVAVTHCSLLFGLVFAGWSAAAWLGPLGPLLSPTAPCSASGLASLGDFVGGLEAGAGLGL
jgi:hypothetical protein